MWRRTRPFDMASALEVFSLALNENGKVFIVPMESGCITGSQPTCAFDEACRCCSVLVIPGFSSFEIGTVPQAREQEITFLQHAHSQGTTLVSLCTGAFWLASCGMLDGRIATTHWQYCEQLGEQYPAINVRHSPVRTARQHLDLRRRQCGNGCMSQHHPSTTRRRDRRIGVQTDGGDAGTQRKPYPDRRCHLFVTTPVRQRSGPPTHAVPRASGASMESRRPRRGIGNVRKDLGTKIQGMGNHSPSMDIARTTSYGAVPSHIHDHAHRFDCPCRRFFGYRPYETSFSPAFRHDAPPIPTPKRTEPFGGFLRKPTKRHTPSIAPKTPCS